MSQDKKGNVSFYFHKQAFKPETLSIDWLGVKFLVWLLNLLTRAFQKAVLCKPWGKKV
jgi:hypothetical protein